MYKYDKQRVDAIPNSLRSAPFLSRVLLLCFFGIILFCVATPIVDNDLFWHLATGRWICEHRQLPTEDPFSYTTSIKAYDESFRAKIILTQYWLANIIEYGSYKAWGYYGIIALRLIIVFLTLFISYKNSRRKGLGLTTSVILHLPLSFVLTQFAGDRPNQMTFLFLALFLYLIENMREAKVQVEVTDMTEAEGPKVKAKKMFLGLKLNLLFLPLVMLLWANMHGGFILGAAIAVIYIFAGLLSTAIGKLASRSVSAPYTPYATPYTIPPVRTTYLVILGITMLTGFLNPNGYTVIYSLVRETSEIYKAAINENRNPFDYIVFGQYKNLYMIVIFLVPAAFSIISRLPLSFKSKNCSAHFLEELFLVIFMGYISLSSIRYIPLMAIAVTPTIGHMMQGRFDEWVKRLSRFMIPELGMIGIFIWVVYSWYPMTVFKGPVLSDYFPKEAVRFIEDRGMKTRIFNYYDWGGFLIWRFYPEKIVFIDGRGLDQRVFDFYRTVIMDDRPIMGEMGMSYKSILNAYSVRNILIPPVDVNGLIQPIVPVLVKDPEWRLIFRSRNCLLFTRDEAGPDLAKVVAYAVILEDALLKVRTMPDNPYPYVAVAMANVGLGRRDDAISFLRKALHKRGSLKGGIVGKALNCMLEGRDDRLNDL